MKDDLPPADVIPEDVIAEIISQNDLPVQKSNKYCFCKINKCFYAQSIFIVTKI